VESGLADRLLVGHLDRFHGRARWAVPAPLDDGVHSRWRALEHALDPSVAEVGDEAGNAEAGGFLAAGSPEEYVLNPPADDDVSAKGVEPAFTHRFVTCRRPVPTNSGTVGGSVPSCSASRLSSSMTTCPRRRHRGDC